jgi:hypothetical protein
LVVQGKLRCLGSNQHLKSKFGKGYVLQLKVGQMPLVVGVTPHSRALQVPIDNEDRAIAFVQGVVPSAIVTQRHMGALSFNAEQLQVPALQLRFIVFLSFRQHAATCTPPSHFVNARISLSAAAVRLLREDRGRQGCTGGVGLQHIADHAGAGFYIVRQSGVMRDWRRRLSCSVAAACTYIHIYIHIHTSTFTYTHPQMRSHNHAQSLLVQTPAAATPALAPGLHALRPRFVYGSINKRTAAPGCRCCPAAHASCNTHSEPPALPPLIATFYLFQSVRSLGFRSQEIKQHTPQQTAACSLQFGCIESSTRAAACCPATTALCTYLRIIKVWVNKHALAIAL